MESEYLHHHHNHNHHNVCSDIELIGAGERVPHSSPSSKRVCRISSKLNTSATNAVVGGSSSISQQQDEGDYVDVTMDIQGGSVAFHIVKDAAGNDLGEDEDLVLLGKGMEKKRSFGAIVVRNASIQMKQVSQKMMKRFATFSKQAAPAASRAAHCDRTKSAATHALKGLRFISNFRSN